MSKRRPRADQLSSGQHSREDLKLASGEVIRAGITIEELSDMLDRNLERVNEDYSTDKRWGQETREMIRHAYLLAEVRSYLGIDEAAFWRRVEKRAEKRVENNDKPESKAPSHNVKSYLRWQAVVEARREGLKRQPRRGTWRNAYNEASQRLAGRPAAGTPRTMKRAYIEIERLHRAAKVGPLSPT